MPVRSLVQCGQRVALIGIDIVHAGQSFATGAAVGDGFFILFIPFTNKKNAKRDDEKIDHQGDEIAVVPSHGAHFPLPLATNSRRDFVRERDIEVVEIETAHEQADRRHEDIFHERVNDSAKGRANDHADGEIDRVTFDGELFEFFPHAACLTTRRTMLTSFFGTTTTLRTVLPAMSC